MSVVSENLKEAERRRQISLHPSAAETPVRAETPSHRKFVFLVILLSLGFAASVFMMLSERRLRLERETELSDKTAELAEKESRIASLVDELASVQQSAKSRISELEFTLGQLSGGFDAIAADNKSLQQKNASLEATNAGLSEQVDTLEREKAKLSEWLQAGNFSR
ncbi:MAG: hypothetical protein HYT89_06225 [Candidatus Omnitrophica bacterium]|nr:hypothetical protein [Candidatus Omnitrophota bacterium]